MLEFDIYKEFQNKKRQTRIVAKGRIQLGSTVAIYGKSGVGKSTVLRAMAGLDVPDKGFIRFNDEIWFDQEKRVNKAIRERNIGFVFQDYNLFPNMSVRKNLEYAAGKPLPEHVDHLLEVTGLTSMLEVYPRDLSGGERQRVSIIRALSQKPQLLLLDEPFSALDDEAIGDVIRELRIIQEEMGTTVVMISHRKDVVLEMADEVIQLRKDEPVIQGKPEDLLTRSF